MQKKGGKNEQKLTSLVDLGNLVLTRVLDSLTVAHATERAFRGLKTGVD